MISFDRIIMTPQKPLKRILKKELHRMGYKTQGGEGFLYAEGDIPVLLVAHLDTVHKEPVSVICKSKDTWMSPQGIGGDDRCGVYSIMKIATTHRPHILFCEDEEIGALGAEEFIKSSIMPEVNFMIELDRRGSHDSVFYDCANKDFETFINGFGFFTSWGSFSDISVLAPHVGVAAVNLSCGYYGAHTLSEYIRISEMENTITAVRNILDAELQKYEYIEKVYRSYSCYDRYDSGSYLNYDYKAYLDKYYGDSKVTVYSKTDAKKEIIWLYPYEYYLSIDGNYFSAEEYGVDYYGNVYIDSVTGPVKSQTQFKFVDATLREVSPLTIYYRAKYGEPY